MQIKVSTKALLYQKFRETADDPSDVICNFIPTPGLAGVQIDMETNRVEQLPEGDLYPCFAYSQRYVYDVVPIEGSRDYRIEAIPMSELARRRS